MKICFLFIMLFCHILDDFYLQGKLAQLKQVEWWQNELGYKFAAKNPQACLWDESRFLT